MVHDVSLDAFHVGGYVSFHQFPQLLCLVFVGLEVDELGPILLLGAPLQFKLARRRCRGVDEAVESLRCLDTVFLFFLFAR